MAFLGLFADCFGRREPRELLRVYVQGQLSAVHRKTAEGIALEFGTAPRTLQRFLESIKWNEERFHDRCQQIVAEEHAHPEAIGAVDESAVAKSGDDTVGVGRQWDGNRGKVDNCVVGVHSELCDTGLPMSVGQRPLPAGRLGERPGAPKKNYVPDEVEFRTKPQIALELIDRALANGVRVAAWTFDELYGRDGKFLDGLERAATDVRGRNSRGLSRLGAEARNPAFRAEKEQETGSRQTVSTPGASPSFLRSSPLGNVLSRVSRASHGNATASRTPTRARRSGKSSGRCSGGRGKMVCPAAGTA